jgi:hypothetical protein
MYKLSEAKTILKTEKVYEVETAFLMNDFGKYRPNITFVIRKDFEGNPVDYRSDPPTKEMVADMNIDFDGNAEVLFGDFWISKKGGACFRPKSLIRAKHVLVRVSWGGAFNDSRGCHENGIGEIYKRRASSNGGGSGYDYWVFPIGFYRVLRDEKVDEGAPATVPDFTGRSKRVYVQFAEYERKKKKKAEKQLLAEAASEAAKKAGLGARLEAVNNRLASLNHQLVELGSTSFRWGWQNSPCLYTEETVSRIERFLEEIVAEAEEKERKLQCRNIFLPKFEKFTSRVEVFGARLGLESAGVRIFQPGRISTEVFSYSDEGLVRFGKELERLEAEVIEIRRQADAQAKYNEAKAEAEKAGLPQNIEIWRRTGGRTNAGNGWVIDQQGQDRDPTSIGNSNLRRLQKYSEGYMVWEQILIGEVVIKWSKASSAAPHEFEVVYFPSEALTEAQLERIKEIQDALEEEWKGACGLASGIPSPPVGDGWGLLPKSPVNQVGDKEGFNNPFAILAKLK